MQATEKIWMNGELVDWDDARVHVLSHALHYGSGVFEGIRAYGTDRGHAVFRLGDHLARLYRSASVYFMDIPYSPDELRAATHETISANSIETCYVRPLVWRGYGPIGLNPLDSPVEVMIAVWPWGTYLGEEALEHGIRACISSWRRIGPNTVPPAAKASGQYLNSQLAKIEAVKSGFDEAILLNEQGFVADGSGENVFVVRDGLITTPPTTASCLPGITRDSVVRIAAELGHPVVERDLARTDLYLADEVFLTGTAAEITPVASVDGHEIGVGPLTRSIQSTFFEITSGRSPLSAEYLDFPERAATPSPSARAS
jgi:branched-chain amino acid aminotransferase